MRDVSGNDSNAAPEACPSCGAPYHDENCGDTLYECGRFVRENGTNGMADELWHHDMCAYATKLTDEIAALRAELADALADRDYGRANEDRMAAEVMQARTIVRGMWGARTPDDDSVALWNRAIELCNEWGVGTLEYADLGRALGWRE